VALEWSETLDGVDWQELSGLYKAAPLGDKPPDKLLTVFSNSRFHVFVREHGKLVGVGRVLADGADCAYICDVALLPSHQGRGLGRGIVARLIELSRGHRKIILYAVPGREKFYHPLGFKRMRTAMAIFENEAAAVVGGYIDLP
jgi:GNAT superfamily N-acetyltransferase